MKDNVDTTGSTGLGTNERKKGVLFTVFVKIPIILMVSIAIVTAGAILGGYLYVTQGLPTIAELRNQDPWAIAEARGNGEMYIPNIVREKIIPVELSDIPDHVINAFLAAEDPRFFVHGFDFSCTVIPVFWRRLWGKPICCFGYTLRGYTIPEQVARMYVPRPFPGPKSIYPLLRMAIMTYRIEYAWDKERILYVYLNRVYLGEGCYGVESAAQHYYGKSVRNLSIAEAALIAGMVASPSGFNPFRGKERSRKKRDWVLKNMLQQGFITEVQCRNALREEITLRKKSEKQGRSDVKTLMQKTETHFTSYSISIRDVGNLRMVIAGV